MTRRASDADLPLRRVAQRLARTLITARHERGWSQLALASASGTTQARIAALERGRGNPTMFTVARVLGALDLELSIRAATDQDDTLDDQAADPRLAALACRTPTLGRRPLPEALAAHRLLLIALAHHRVRAIIVGGVAAIIHGVQHHTDDLDILYARDAANLHRLAALLAAARPHPTAPDVATLRAGLNFSFDTRVGALDVKGHVPGGGRYEDLIARTERVSCFSVEWRVLDRDTLIRVARAAGRPRDLDRAARLIATPPPLLHDSTLPVASPSRSSPHAPPSASRDRRVP